MQCNKYSLIKYRYNLDIKIFIALILLLYRPIVIPNGVEVVVKADDSTRHIPWVSFDGRNRQQLQEGERIKINIDNNPVPCLNNTGHISDWFKSLVEGLNWNVRQGQKKL